MKGLDKFELIRCRHCNSVGKTKINIYCPPKGNVYAVVHRCDKDTIPRMAEYLFCHGFYHYRTECYNTPEEAIKAWEKLNSKNILRQFLS